MSHKWDLLGFGFTAVDDLLFVTEFPKPDARTEVLQKQRRCGGLARTAMVAASRLGVRCAYAGLLGTDELSGYILKDLVANGIDASEIIRKEGFGPCHSTIIVDMTSSTRNIFYDISKVHLRTSEAISDELLQSAKYIYMDQLDVAEMISIARRAKVLNCGTIADYDHFRDPKIGELLSLTDHLIVSHETALDYTSTANAADAARKLAKTTRRCTVVTDGARGCYCVEGNSGTAQYFPAFNIKAVDTTGCGDVFHGAYVAGLIKSMPLSQCIQFASAAAAMKAGGFNHASGIPDETAINDFLMKTG